MKKGMTLIEVIIAVLILSTGMTVLLTGASRCVAVMKKAANYQKAQWVLGMGNLEHPLTATNEPMDLAVGPIDYEGFKYVREVEEDDDKDGLFVLRERAIWSYRGSEAYEEAVRYVLDRTPKDEE